MTRLKTASFFSVRILTCVTALSGALLFAALTPEQWMLGPFTRPEGSAPILSPIPASTFMDPIRKEAVHWESLHTFNPAAIVRGGKIDVLYRAEDNSGDMAIGHHTSRLGLAESDDGIHFTRNNTPVFYPDNDDQKSREWPGGVEDPRIVEAEDGHYVLTYTQWNRQTYTVGIATSSDLLHWKKYGPAFQDVPSGKYKSLMYKSAGIVTRLEGERLVAARVNGKYWMYWGEGEIHLATSDDLIHWRPKEDASGNALVVLRKRAGHFDSSFPEVGPPPLLTDKGIVLIYNGKNSPEGGDPNLGPNAYAAGQALFSAKDPSQLLARTEGPFLKPERPYEKTGQYAAGTTFAEGLVRFKGKWFLYYGCADSKVGVVIANAKR